MLEVLVRFPMESYQLQEVIGEHFPQLRPAQQRALALWVYGTILAKSACQNAVIVALSALAGWDTLRQYLRELFYDGSDKAAPCRTEIDVGLCFAPLLRWLLSWWQSQELALAIDATAHGDQVVALVVSVLYRGSAIPVAWHVLPANKKGAWVPKIIGLLESLHPAVGSKKQVLVLADRGLWSPRLWAKIRDLGWHPMIRVQLDVTFAPAGQQRQAARQLVPGPGHGWVGRGVAFKDRKVRRAGTLIVVWAQGQQEPWVVLTDLPPKRVGVCWYGLRIWIELGFRALKGVGWQWQRTRRTEPSRVSRYWLVLAVATLWVMATGTRVEDARELGIEPSRLRTPPSPPTYQRQRQVSVFCLGLSYCLWQFMRGWIWRRLWLAPEPWPRPLADLQLVYHVPT